MHSGSFLSLVQTLSRKAYFVIVSTIASPLQFFRRPHQKIQRLALAELTVERLSAFVSPPYLISSCRHGQVLINKSHVEVFEWLLCGAQATMFCPPPSAWPSRTLNAEVRVTPAMRKCWKVSQSNAEQWLSACPGQQPKADPYDECH